MSLRTYFNAHHSPIGAFATLTFGCKGALGGLGMEAKGPVNESVFFGIEEAKRPGMYQALPFFDGQSKETSADDYDVEGLSQFRFRPAVFPFPDDQISRRLGAATDTWTAGDLTLTVFTPVRPIPDPESASELDLKLALVPATLVEMTVDNSAGSNPRKVFFGYSGADRTKAMHCWRDEDITAVGQGTLTAIATQEAGAYGGVAWQPEAILNPRHEENLDFTLGTNGLLVATIPAGTKRTIRFAVAYYASGQTTTGLVTNFYYQSLFQDIKEVIRFALAHFDAIIAPCWDFDRLSSDQSAVRAEMLGHAIKSYYGSTQLLRRENGKPLWVVNEGEYRMMNTLDLTVDQLFFELALNPWTVRNVLDLFVERYSYWDEVKSTGSEATYPGGLTFTHDMGVASHFSPEGHSCYEQAGLSGVFSYMSFEELVNWVLCACVYLSHTRDMAWLKKIKETLGQALTSLMNRDHPEASLRNGVMGLDSSRCRGGQEITTYDSLDSSLGQARNNLYLAVKTWAAYALMEEHLRTVGNTPLASAAKDQARLCSETIVGAVDADGFLPAILGEGVEARIIPAIEGLIYPFIAGRPELVSPDGPYGPLRQALERHFDLCLSTGICRFPDGGWKLSSTSQNSWLSKIYLCQYISEAIFGREPDTVADAAHLAWLMDEDNAYFSWSDQMVAGKAHGSRYYPRGVTAILWLAGSSKTPLHELQTALQAPKTNKFAVR